MIRIGLTGWGDHDLIYAEGLKPKDKLKTYSGLFGVVEVDSSFYAVQPTQRMAGWAEETPADFQFVVKAYQGMTGHLRGKPYFTSEEQMYEAFRESLAPVAAAGKLKAVLFQYPPWFDCTRDNVNVLRRAKAYMEGFPCALEFRHQSWFTPEFSEKTLGFMEREGWIHSICDEPQAGEGSVPTVLRATHPEVSIVRLHGRNVSGWNQGGASNWREVRYLYQYNPDELMEWQGHIAQLQAQSKDICVIFNNNSGGHAAGNALELMGMLGLRKPDEPALRQAAEEAPEQLHLFD